jgi:hypothetical protein
MILLRPAHRQPVLNMARGPGCGPIYTGMSPHDGGKQPVSGTDGAALACGNASI